MKHRFFKFGIGLVILAATTTSTQLYIGFLQWGQEFGTLGQFNRVAKVIESMDGYSSPQNRLNRELTLIDIDHLNFFIYKIKTPDGQTAEVRFALRDTQIQGTQQGTAKRDYFTTDRIAASVILMNLNQVTLPVKNIPEGTAFYRKLGFNQIVDSVHYARFECPDGNATFSLSLEEDFANGTTIYFEHKELDTWVEVLRSKGIEFDQLPTDMSWLWREAVLHDPSGNKVKLYWAGENRLNPPWRVN